MAVSGNTLGQGEKNNPKESGLSTVADQNSLSKTVGFGSDSDSQNSVTQSGINTRNISITDEAGQTKLTGLTAEETKANIYTTATTETAQNLSGSLKNSFDKDKVQSELDLQRTVSQDFSKNVQQANTEINQHLDKLKADKEAAEKAAAEALANGDIETAERKIKEADAVTIEADNWQRGKVILNMIASGLAAPTQSGAGIAAATASPAVSYAIGQEFKKIAEENKRKGITEEAKLTKGQETAHILAHAVLGAAVSAAGGNDALAGALSAGGAEAAAPIISYYLYGEKDGSKLSSEQKETIVAITSLAGTAAGAVVGNTAADAVSGSLNANSAVRNNYLTATEINSLVEHQRACQNGNQQACIKRDKLIELDKQRDWELLVACHNPQSQTCHTLRREAEKAQASLNTGFWAKYTIWTNEYRDKDKLAAHNKEYGETDTIVLLSYGKTPEEIASNTQLLNFASKFLTDLSIAGTIKDFKDADSVKDYAIATMD